MGTPQIEALLADMARAWAAGDGRLFAAHFAPEGQFIAFDGSVHVGPQAIAEFHQTAFDGPLRGSSLRMRIHSARILSDVRELVTTRGGVHKAGSGDDNIAADSIQTLIVRHGQSGPRIEALQNARFRPIIDGKSAALWHDFDDAFRASQST